MELKTPTKNAKGAVEPFIIDDKRLSQSPTSSANSTLNEEESHEEKKVEEEVDNLGGFARKYVGEVDLPEGELNCHVLHCYFA